MDSPVGMVLNMLEGVLLVAALILAVLLPWPIVIWLLGGAFASWCVRQNIEWLRP